MNADREMWMICEVYSNLTHQQPMLPSYGTQSIDLLCKSIDHFLYEGNIGPRWVNNKEIKITLLMWFKCYYNFPRINLQWYFCVLLMIKPNFPWTLIKRFSWKKKDKLDHLHHLENS